MNIDSILFDLDGTLWDSTNTIVESWNSVIADIKEIKAPITLGEMQKMMGLQLPVIGEKLFGYLDKTMQKKITEHCCEIECEWVRKQGGILYPRLEETLNELSKKYKLFIVSNCQAGYIEAFLEYHKLGKYFTDFEFAGNKGLSKGENIKNVIKRNNLKKSVYVGDTQGDCDAAKVAEVPFVFAKYGFGQVDSYDYVIDKFEQLKKIASQFFSE